MFACMEDLTDSTSFQHGSGVSAIGEVSKGLTCQWVGKYEEKYDLKKRVEKMDGLQY
jgi:hypothetical protein